MERLDPKSLDCVKLLYAKDLNKESHSDNPRMDLIDPTHLVMVGGVGYHSNKEISQYLARRNAGVEKLYYTSGAALNPKAKFEIVDLEKFQFISQGTRNTHFIGLALSSNTTSLSGAIAAIVSEGVCDFRWSCAEGTPEEELLRRIKKEISLTFDAFGEGPTPEVIERCFSAPFKANVYASILVGALAF